MIGRADIIHRVREWGLREDVVEKDYVLGWVLWGVGAHPHLGSHWVFKGGTCIKKCYIETYRFSEDLDFSVLPGGPLHPDDVLAVLREVLPSVGDQSGIDFTVREPRIRLRPSGLSAEGRIYYRGPLQVPGVASIKIDLSGDEEVVRPSVLRPIAHPYPDAFPAASTVRCYSFEELFAEKIRAMGQRGRPRDLYDIVNLFRRHDLRLHPDLIRTVLVEKCRTKSIDVPTYDTIAASPRRAELESEWANMLGHQLPALPPLEQFLEELPHLFGWLDGTEVIVTPEAYPIEPEEDTEWSPPPTVATWGVGIPLEVIRFAATNHLLVELGYQGTTRLIEPYSLRQTRAGSILLHALRADTRAHRSYRVNQIQHVRVTTTPFRPTFAIEFSSAGPLSAPPARSPIRLRRAVSARRPSSRRGGISYVIECPVCNKRFRRTTRGLTLRPHKTPGGWNCSGRRGYLVDTTFG
jgi:predicted nucleotidyltransferase component of viral defense system